MSSVIDLQAKLGNLQNHVNAKRLEQCKQKQERQAATQSQRAADWARVRTDYPDHARVITAIVRGFGKPARVVVKAGGETLLDSRRYE